MRPILVAVVFALVLPAAAAAQERPDLRGMVFVHGSFGSGGQFESQALRFAANGYPIDHIRAVDYDSVLASNVSEETAFSAIDQAIEQLKAATGQRQVDLLGHSLGTTVSLAYLRSSPERAANVANYVNIDGRESPDLPGGVRTLALWAEYRTRTAAPDGFDRRFGGGAENVYLDEQTHVQAATSEEAFAAMYRFFTGEAPRTTKVEPTPGPITLKGRALVFPQNVALSALEVRFWAIDPATGARTTTSPETTTPISGDEGEWGPVRVTAGRHYEMELVRPGALTLHFYFEPFLRSDHQVRLLYGEAVEAAIQPRGEDVGGALVLRYKEFWGDRGPANDRLEVNGLNICNAIICPIAGNVLGIFVYDFNGDRQTDLTRANPIFEQLPFLSGADVFLPATRAPTGSTSYRLVSRGGGPARTITVPDFPSITDQAFVSFNDFDQPTDLSAYATPSLEPFRLGLVHKRAPIGIRGTDENIGCRSVAPTLRLRRCVVTLRARVRGRRAASTLGRGVATGDRRSMKVDVDLTPAGRALLGRRPSGFRATIVARATDAAGRTRTATERTALRRGRPARR